MHDATIKMTVVMFMHTQNIAPECVENIVQVLNLAMGNSSKVFQY
jgi:hypothetical protein